MDAKLEKADRNICLLVDNCSAHHVVSHLKRITIKFLTLNTMARLQPFDQGIIKALKVGYRRHLVQRLLINLRLEVELKINLLRTIQIMTRAWNNVKKTTVVNCFSKAGLLESPDHLGSDMTAANDL